MTRRWNKRGLILGITPVLGLAVWGCTQLIGGDGYHEVAAVPDAGDAGSDAPPEAATDVGPTSDGCVVDASDRPSFENTCAPGVECATFTKTIPYCDGGRCPITPAAPYDGGSTDAGGDAARPNPCELLPNPVFVPGANILKTTITQVASYLATQTTPITVIYQNVTACFAVSAALDPTNNPLTPAEGATFYYDQTGTQKSCDLAPNQQADIGGADLFATSCAGALPSGTLPSDVGDFLGPIEVFNFVVPVNSTENSINLDAAYYVFGGGGTPPIAPWTNPLQMMIRQPSAGQIVVLSVTLGLNPNNWYGVPFSTATTQLAAIGAAGKMGDPTASQTIGFAASIDVDNNRLAASAPQSVKILALKDDSNCAYYPDATQATYDKKNVREGRYPLWGPIHLLTHVDSNLTPVNPNAATFINVFTGTTAIAGLDVIQFYAGAHVIPTCAMRVQRSDDGEDYQPYNPRRSCACYYDSLVPGGSTSCATCNVDSDCPSGTQCNNFGTQGYCELIGTDP